MVARNNKRVKLVQKFAEKRAIAKLENNQEALQKLPRNSNKIRIKNRCFATGRQRGYMREFGLSRIKFRELAIQGFISGVRKSSW